MADPKYIIKENKLHHIDGYQIPDNEPLMTLRAKDIGALYLIVKYIEMLEGQPINNTIESHLVSSTERLKAFYYYQINNPDLQSVGCSNKSHVNSEMFIELAKCKLKELGEI